MQKLLTFFSAKNIRVYAIFNDQSYNDTLTNDIVSLNNLVQGLKPGYRSSDIFIYIAFEWKSAKEGNNESKKVLKTEIHYI